MLTRRAVHEGGLKRCGCAGGLAAAWSEDAASLREGGGLNFDELSSNHEALSHRKARKRLPLRFEAEPGAALRLTVTWYALRLGPSTFGIFDTFPGDAGRQAHLNGRVAAALMAKAGELLSQPPKIEQVDVLAAKLP